MTKYLLPLSCLMLLCAAGAVGFSQLSWQWVFLPELMDALHLPSAMLLMYCLNHWFGRYHRPNALFAVAISVLLLIEVIQPYVGRHGEWNDLLHGCVGVLLVRYWVKIQRFWRLLLVIAALLLSGRELLSAFAFQAYAKSALPNLMINPFLPTTFGWQAIAGSEFETQQTASSQLQFAVALQMPRWQGVFWRNPGLDFTLVQEMCFSARASSPLHLQIRIDDNDSYHYQSRLNTTVKLHNGWQRFCIDVSQIKDMQQRLLDKKNINTIYFFSQPASGNQGDWFALADVALWYPTP